MLGPTIKLPELRIVSWAMSENTGVTSNHATALLGLLRSHRNGRARIRLGIRDRAGVVVVVLPHRGRVWDRRISHSLKVGDHPRRRISHCSTVGDHLSLLAQARAGSRSSQAGARVQVDGPRKRRRRTSHRLLLWRPTCRVVLWHRDRKAKNRRL